MGNIKPSTGRVRIAFAVTEWKSLSDSRKKSPESESFKGQMLHTMYENVVDEPDSSSFSLV